MKRVAPGCLLLLCWLTGCQSLRPPALPPSTDTYCTPAVSYAYDSAYLPRPDVPLFLRQNPALTRHYSLHDLLTANAVGILPLLGQLTALAGQPGPDAQLRRVQFQQQIQNQLFVATTQVSGLAAELDCEGERADQIATYLDQRDTRRIRRLTITSVVVGAVTTVASALISSAQADKAVSIGGGVVSAGFGGAAAFSSDKTVRFNHRRNLLTDIWQQSGTSSVYPPVVWYVLNEKAFSNEQTFSISHNIRQRWIDYVLNRSSAEQQKLYFGEGGSYQADDLHSRANMLNQLQSSVRSINQDLQSLALTLAR